MTQEPSDPSVERPTARRALAGAAIGAAWLAGLFVAEPLIDGSVVAAIAEAIIVRSPGWLSTLAIGLLGFYATPVLVAAVAAGVIGTVALLAAAFPLVSSRAAAAFPRVSRRVATVLPPPLHRIRAVPSLRSRRSVVVALAALVATVPLFRLAGVEPSAGALVGLVVAVTPPSLVARGLPIVESTTDRRGFLRLVGGAGIVGAASLAGLRALFARLPDGGRSERAGEPLERSVSLPSGDPEFDFAGMPMAVTSPGDHYVIDINVDPPRVDPETWTLDVRGAVEQPYSLSYDELLDHDERVEQPTTMICISNEVGGDLIGTGHWTGVQLSDLVAAAGPTDGAVDVVTHAADGYSEALPIDLVEREDVLIAYGMGTRTLTTEHGFPARLLIPGRYGMKMTKWIDRIEVVEADHEGYWAERGWNDEAVVNTMSYTRGATRNRDNVVVGGVAFGGLETGVEEISAVEVSVDDGETWHETELESQLGAHAWRRWRYEFEAPDRSEFDVVVRAVRREDGVQTDAETSPRPNGATGWHRTTISVE